MVANTFDDDLDPTNGDTGHYGAGPVVISPAVSAPGTRRVTIDEAGQSARVQPKRSDGTPGLELNYDETQRDEIHGDMVAGTYGQNTVNPPDGRQRGDDQLGQHGNHTIAATSCLTTLPPARQPIRLSLSECDGRRFGTSQAAWTTPRRQFRRPDAAGPVRPWQHDGEEHRVARHHRPRLRPSPQRMTISSLPLVPAPIRQAGPRRRGGHTPSPQTTITRP